MSDGVLVRDPASLLAALERLFLATDSVNFWNDGRSMKMGIRSEPADEDDYVDIEVYLVMDSAMKEPLSMSDDGYIDDDKFVVRRWTFPMVDFTVAKAEKIATLLNEMYLYRLCPCGKYIIKDDALLCVYCQLTATTAERATHYCPICCQDGVLKHMEETACCKQMLHRHCQKRWRLEHKQCPLCRRG